MQRETVGINDLIIEMNRAASAQFIAEEPARRRYWAKHPTYISFVVCMDGRVHPSTMTNTLMGTIKPWRAIGGSVEMFWPGFRKRHGNFVQRAMSHGKRNALLVSYHYSKSNEHYGCAGWEYDTRAARRHAEKLAEKAKYVYGEQVDTFVVAIETDDDVMTLHGSRGDVSGEQCMDGGPESGLRRIMESFPGLSDQAGHDLLPLMMGNARHIHELRSLTTEDRPREIDHSERIIAIGHGFYGVRDMNLMLELSDADPKLDDAIIVQGRIITKNLKGALKANEDVTIFSNIAFRESGQDRREAEVSSMELQAFAQRELRKHCPELWGSGRLHFISGATDERTLELHVLEQGKIMP